MPLVTITKDFAVDPIMYRVADGNNNCFVDDKTAEILIKAEAAVLCKPEEKELPQNDDVRQESDSQ